MPTYWIEGEGMPATWCKSWSTVHGRYRLTSLRWDQTTQTVEEPREEHWEEQQEEQQQEEQISEEKISEEKISAAIPDARARALALYKKLAKSPPSRKAMLRAKTLELYKRLVKKSKKRKASASQGSTSSSSSGN